MARASKPQKLFQIKIAQIDKTDTLFQVVYQPEGDIPREVMKMIYKATVKGKPKIEETPSLMRLYLPENPSIPIFNIIISDYGCAVGYKSSLVKELGAELTIIESHGLPIYDEDYSITLSGYFKQPTVAKSSSFSSSLTGKIFRGAGAMAQTLRSPNPLLRLAVLQFGAFMLGRAALGTSDYNAPSLGYYHPTMGDAPAMDPFAFPWSLGGSALMMGASYLTQRSMGGSAPTGGLTQFNQPLNPPPPIYSPAYGFSQHLTAQTHPSSMVISPQSSMGFGQMAPGMQYLSTSSIGTSAPMGLPPVASSYVASSGSPFAAYPSTYSPGYSSGYPATQPYSGFQTTMPGEAVSSMPPLTPGTPYYGPVSAPGYPVSSMPPLTPGTPYYGPVTSMPQGGILTGTPPPTYQAVPNMSPYISQPFTAPSPYGSQPVMYSGYPPAGQPIYPSGGALYSGQPIQPMFGQATLPDGSSVFYSTDTSLPRPTAFRGMTSYGYSDPSMSYLHPGAPEAMPKSLMSYNQGLQTPSHLSLGAEAAFASQIIWSQSLLTPQTRGFYGGKMSAIGIPEIAKETDLNKLPPQAVQMMPRLGMVTILPPKIAPALGMGGMNAPALSLLPLFKRSKPLDEAAMLELQKSLPKGATFAYPALPTNQLNAGAVNVPLTQALQRVIMQRAFPMGVPVTFPPAVSPLGIPVSPSKSFMLPHETALSWTEMATLKPSATVISPDIARRTMVSEEEPMPTSRKLEKFASFGDIGAPGMSPMMSYLESPKSMKLFGQQFEISPGLASTASLVETAPVSKAQPLIRTHEPESVRTLAKTILPVHKTTSIPPPASFIRPDVKQSLLHDRPTQQYLGRTQSPISGSFAPGMFSAGSETVSGGSGIGVSYPNPITPHSLQQKYGDHSPVMRSLSLPLAPHETSPSRAQNSYAFNYEPTYSSGIGPETGSRYLQPFVNRNIGTPEPKNISPGMQLGDTLSAPTPQYLSGLSPKPSPMIPIPLLIPSPAEQRNTAFVPKSSNTPSVSSSMPAVQSGGLSFAQNQPGSTPSAQPLTTRRPTGGGSVNPPRMLNLSQSSPVSSFSGGGGMGSAPIGRAGTVPPAVSMNLNLPQMTGKASQISESSRGLTMPVQDFLPIHFPKQETNPFPFNFWVPKGLTPPHFAYSQPMWAMPNKVMSTPASVSQGLKPGGQSSLKIQRSSSSPTAPESPAVPATGPGSSSDVQQGQAPEQKGLSSQQMEELSRQVYFNLKRRLVGEYERVRGHYLSSNQE